MKRYLPTPCIECGQFIERRDTVPVEDDTAPRYVKQSKRGVFYLHRNDAKASKYHYPFCWRLDAGKTAEFTKREAHALKRVLPGSVVVKGRSKC